MFRCCPPPFITVTAETLSMLFTPLILGFSFFLLLLILIWEEKTEKAPRSQQNRQEAEKSNGFGGDQERGAKADHADDDDYAETDILAKGYLEWR